MATYQYCDHVDHEKEGGAFTPATTKIDIVKRDAKKENTIHVTAAKDSCDEHIGYFAEYLFKQNRKDVLFVEVRLNDISKPRRPV